MTRNSDSPENAGSAGTVAPPTPYLGALLATEKYGRTAQLVLKERVFRTFDRLLVSCNSSGMTPGKRLLDLGSAGGALVDVATANGLEAVGLDVTDGLDFESDDLPLPDAHFDVVTLVAVIEHLREPAKLLRETLRVLKPGGAFIIVTPNWRYSYRNFFDDPTHLRPYTEKSLGYLLTSFGFDGVDVVPWLVCKPAWMWRAPYAFQLARLIPFRGQASRLIPRFLKGQSKSLLGIGFRKPAPAVNQ
ncbi:MAG: class I SAM-dependent methyltransferase [Gemmatimonadaceae bacterium]|nr:class I SAM-dependent methyltransferase [Gemmatimonadaceae bacterium]